MSTASKSSASLTLDGEALRAIRHRTALTQKQVARQLGVPRELVSMWESEAREPKPEQMQALADVLLVPEELLVGRRSVSAWQRNRFLSGMPASDAKREVERWLQFLDEWGRFKKKHFASPGEPDKPPRPLDRPRFSTLAVPRPSPTKCGTTTAWGGTPFPIFGPSSTSTACLRAAWPLAASTKSPASPAPSTTTSASAFAR